ncbi:MAG: LytTR family transcriptional regulator DNA-binding domain-containing protein [Bacteroidales bacterium]|nr:LytTR family transcriptional regulator DNA-binding domain-containing protein [Bacteroidales bacterium]MBS3775570.1 LytTR family transcriptional regulator DNA-binding domain-containing protein [Bacteroidales bacterium]
MKTKIKSDFLYQHINKEFKLFAGIGFGIFLFLLFFQPFTLNNFDFNNQILFLLGVGAILFMFMAVVRVGLPWWVEQASREKANTVLQPYVNGFLIFILNAVALPFYLRYVGSVDITFYVIFKVVFICIIPPLILRVYDTLEALKQQNESYLEKNKRLQSLVDQLKEFNRNETITLVSENSSEKLNFPVSDVVMIRSADNYVEIVYKEGDNFKKQLLRNTLKHIEHQTTQYASFIRCHRTCIINIHHTENLYRRQNSYWLSIKNYTEQVPVSRQYLMWIKEAIPARKG